jgi:hypothetical protein
MVDGVGVHSELSVLSQFSRAFTNIIILETAIWILLRAMNLRIPEQFNDV